TDGNSTVLLSEQIQQIESPSYVKDKVLFKANYNGIDNVYLLDPKTSTIRQVTNVRYGAFDPSYHHTTDQLVFSSYNGRDYQISILPFDERKTTLINDAENKNTGYFKPLQA